MIITFITIILLIFCDQYLKYYVATHFELYQTKPIIDGILNFTYIHNDGAGWGIFAGQRLFFIVVTVLIIIYLFYILMKQRHQKWYKLIWIGFILAGAFGNLIDRILLGYVIDMFDLAFIQFPIFNIADVALTVGIIGLFIVTILSPEEESLI
ncbi:signal peptidase II [Aerococcaceae bacterium DSM 111020]|nr:signal peptidase II [Aerococcaceae bacterium DSM 111020]